MLKHGADPPDNTGVTAGRRLDAEGREAAARKVLAEHPNALVAALNDDGVFVRMPDGVPLAGHVAREVGSGSTFSLVTPAERPTIISVWEEARESGMASAQLHLITDPNDTATIQIFDVRETHGVFLGMLITDADITQLLESAPRLRAPRLARVRKDGLAVFLEIDEATTAILGWEADEIVGHRTLDFIHPDDHESGIGAWMEMLAAPGSSTPTRLRHRHKDGHWVWIEVTNHNRLADPEHGDVISDFIDITDEVTTHEELRGRERLLDRIAEALPIGLCQADSERHIVYTNARLHEILGTSQAATLDEQLASVLPDDWGALDAALDGALTIGVDTDLEVQVHRFGRLRLRRCLARVRALTDDEGAPTGAILCVEDVTESAQMRAELERRASYDMLTHCHNRSAVMAALELELELAQGPATNTAAIFVDLDRFKRVNDRFGHAAGDELLVVVANRITAAIRDDDILGRLGGDEFLVVCSKIGSSAEALDVGRRIGEALSGEVSLEDARVSLKASVGVACSDGAELTADELVSRADAAMYDSKNDGAGRAVLFDGAADRSTTR